MSAMTTIKYIYILFDSDRRWRLVFRWAFDKNENVSVSRPRPISITDDKRTADG